MFRPTQQTTLRKPADPTASSTAVETDCTAARCTGSTCCPSPPPQPDRCPSASTLLHQPSNAVHDVSFDGFHETAEQEHQHFDRSQRRQSVRLRQLRLNQLIRNLLRAEQGRPRQLVRIVDRGVERVKLVKDAERIIS